MKRLVLMGVFISVMYGDGVWKAETIMEFEKGIGRIRIGRRSEDDDTLRLYAGVDYKVVEITYSDGKWHVIPVCTLDNVREIGFGKIKPDSVLRLYASASGDSILYEYRFDDGWVKDDSLKFGENIYGFVCADGRNDGINRLYVKGRDYLYELEYRDGWCLDTLGKDLYYFDVGAGITRNDGIVKVYDGFGFWNIGVTEWTYKDGEWSKLPCWAGGSLLGDADNDGMNEFYGYATLTDPFVPALLVVEWQDTGWVTTDEVYLPWELCPSVIGDARNEGKNRLYLININSVSVAEAEYRGSSWDVRIIYYEGSSTAGNGGLFHGPLNPSTPMVIGRLRHDDINRLYLTSWHKIIELTYYPQGVEEAKEKDVYLYSTYLTDGVVRFDFQGLDLPFVLEVYDVSGRLLKRDVVKDRRYELRGLVRGVYFLKFPGKRVKVIVD